MTREPLLTLDELAAEWRVSKQTLYREHKRGKLKYERMVVGVRVTRSEADRYLREHTSTGPGSPALPSRWTLYRFFDAEGVLLYVGITGHGAARWAQHSKEQPWWTEVATIRVEHFPSLEAVAMAEIYAIRDEAPRYNKAGR